MGVSQDAREAEYWEPVKIDENYITKLRKNYPEHADLSDEDLLWRMEIKRFGESQKYAVLWDHIGDAYEYYEPLADAYFRLREENKRLRKLVRNTGINPRRFIG